MRGVRSVKDIKARWACFGDQFRNICSSSAFPPRGKFRVRRDQVFPIEEVLPAPRQQFSGSVIWGTVRESHLGTQIGRTRITQARPRRTLAPRSAV